MPIKPENRALYPKDWPAISRRIRARSGQQCERCRAPNGKLIARARGTYMLENGDTFNDTTGEYLGCGRGSEFPADRFVRVVLTVAHLDHDPTNNADSNLQALCQQCHLRHDAKHHALNAAHTRRERRDAESGQQGLFGGDE